MENASNSETIEKAERNNLQQSGKTNNRLGFSGFWSLPLKLECGRISILTQNPRDESTYSQFQFCECIALHHIVTYFTNISAFYRKIRIYKHHFNDVMVHCS